jgi:hypothetical protein
LTPSDEEAAVDLIADGRAIAPEERLGVADDMRAALGSLHKLGEREAAILRMWFGFDDEGPALEFAARKQTGREKLAACYVGWTLVPPIHQMNPRRSPP